MLGAIAKSVFGTANQRYLSRLQRRVGTINALESELEALSDEGLIARTAAFRDRLEAGETLDDILEEASGAPVLCGYVFRPDAVRIKQRFPFALNLTGLSGQEFNKAIDDFAEGRIRLLIGHPASMGHGTDGLQHGGQILAWFGLPWSLELYLQLNKRLHRRGQEAPVRAYRILGADTMDQMVATALGYKAITQDTLRAAVAKYRQERGL